MRGHMARGIRSLRERLRLCDIAVEVLDARAPLSSRNPRLEEHLQQKPRLIVLSRADLADPVVTQSWQTYLKHRAHRHIPSMREAAKEQLPFYNLREGCVLADRAPQGLERGAIFA